VKKGSLLLVGLGIAVSQVAVLGAAPAGAAVRGPLGSERAVTAATVDNPIWAGYAVPGVPGQFSTVAASWTQPTASCTAGTTSFASFWAGIDGYNSRTVEQIGTDSDCRSGTATYYAWYELYPKKTVLLPMTITAGEAISVSVSFAGGVFSLTLNGVTVIATDRSAARSSAEVIAEAPSSNHGPFGALPLTDFGVVSFTGASVNGADLATFSPDQLVINKAGTVEATPSSSLSGGSFSVTWLHS
jgi:hypothetical protein